MVYFAILIVASLSGALVTEDEVFLCKCEVMYDNASLDWKKHKEVYVFLVSGPLANGCCDNPVIEKYPGFLEKWESDSHEHPQVFSRPSGSEKGLPSRETRECVCAVEKKIQALASARKFPVREYYPDFKLDN